MSHVLPTHREVVSSYVCSSGQTLQVRQDDVCKRVQHRASEGWLMYKKHVNKKYINSTDCLICIEFIDKYIHIKNIISFINKNSINISCHRVVITL